MANVLQIKNTNTEERKWFYAIIALFIVSRIILHLSRISFDTNSITYGTWQLIAPDLLKNKLLESLYYLHSQPPLYNLYVGIVLKLFPENYSAFFQLNFLLLGLLTHTTLFVIMRHLTVRPSIAFILTLLMMLSPSIILYENWLSYTYIVIALLTFSTLFLLRFLQSEKFSDGLLFFLFLALIVLTRSMYHIAWFGVIILLLLITRFKIRRKILLSASVPFLIVFAFFFKNYLLFNTFSTSSWMGMSLYEISLSRIDKKKLEPFVASGEVSPIVLVPAFWSLDHYNKFITKTNPYPNVRVLSDSFNLKEANYHNYHYLEVSELYKKGAIKIIKHYPMEYLKNVAISFGYYFYPASNYPLLEENSSKMFWYNKLYNHLVLWTIYNPEEVDRKPPFRIEYALSLSLLLILSFVVCGTIGLQQLWKHKLSKTFIYSLPAVVTTYLVLTIAYTMVVGNFFEQGENMRFRFQTSTMCLIVVGLVIEYVVGQKKKTIQ
ncbi:MAG: glycosyltransferase family 39 protein [Chryseolinea sp.]